MSDTMNTFREFRDLHPKRLASGLLDDDDAPPSSSGSSDQKSSGQATSKPTQSFDPDLS
jgi:hypothetical protein